MDQYICSECGKEVLIEQPIYDGADLDGKCHECYYIKK